MKERQTGREPRVLQYSRNGFEPVIGPYSNEEVRLRAPDSLLDAPEVVGRSKPLIIFAIHDAMRSDLLSMVAASKGYDVRKTVNGREAVAMVRGLLPDLIVLDMRLFVWSGGRALTYLRSYRDPLVAHMPVIATGDHLDVSVIRDIFTTGADDYLPLSANYEEYLTAFRRHITTLRRPSPLGAIFSPYDQVRSAAVECLKTHRTSKLFAELDILVNHPDRTVRRAAESIVYSYDLS